MKTIWKFISSTLVGGLLVLLPAYLAILLIAKGVKGLAQMAQPLVKMLPIGVEHQAIAALGVVVVASFVVGLAVTTWPGRPLGRWLDKGLLDRIPGYTFLRSLLGRTFGDQSSEFRVAMVEIEEALVVGYVVEEMADGRYTVFVPASPTPFTGAVYVLTPERVHIIDVPFTQAFSSMTKWGTGVRELIAAMDKQKVAAAKSA